MSQVICRFYGRNGMFGRLIDSGGNECGLVRTSYSPCRMELKGGPVDEHVCPLVAQLGGADAAQRATRQRNIGAEIGGRLCPAHP